MHDALLFRYNSITPPTPAISMCTLPCHLGGMWTSKQVGLALASFTRCGRPIRLYGSYSERYTTARWSVRATNIGAGAACLMGWRRSSVRVYRLTAVKRLLSL